MTPTLDLGGSSKLAELFVCWILMTLRLLGGELVLAAAKVKTPPSLQRKLI
jgi:hypothetical protein